MIYIKKHFSKIALIFASLFVLASLTSCLYIATSHLGNSCEEDIETTLIDISEVESINLKEERKMLEQSTLSKNDLKLFSLTNDCISDTFVIETSEETDSEHLLLTRLFFSLDSNSNKFTMSKTMELSVAVNGQYTIDDGRMTLIPGGIKSTEGYLYVFKLNDNDTVEFCKEWSSEIPEYEINDKTVFTLVRKNENESLFAINEE